MLSHKLFMWLDFKISGCAWTVALLDSDAQSQFNIILIELIAKFHDFDYFWAFLSICLVSPHLNDYCCFSYFDWRDLFVFFLSSNFFFSGVLITHRFSLRLITMVLAFIACASLLLLACELNVNSNSLLMNLIMFCCFCCRRSRFHSSSFLLVGFFTKHSAFHFFVSFFLYISSSDNVCILLETHYVMSC